MFILLFHNVHTQEGKEATASGRADIPSKDAYYGLVSGPVTILHPLHGCTDPHGLTRTLLELQPTYVVLYDPDMQFVRQLEVCVCVRWDEGERGGGRRAKLTCTVLELQPTYVVLYNPDLQFVQQLQVCVCVRVCCWLVA